MTFQLSSGDLYSNHVTPILSQGFTCARRFTDLTVMSRYDHILLDDCWGQRDNLTQEIIGDPHRFPEGMKAFTSKIHALGFKFGIYTDIGTAGCHHPFTGSFGHYRDDAATFKEWGIDYVKFDGCDLPHGYTAEELTCNMSQALLDTGEDFWFNFHVRVPPLYPHFFHFPLTHTHNGIHDYQNKVSRTNQSQLSCNSVISSVGTQTPVLNVAPHFELTMITTTNGLIPRVL